MEGALTVASAVFLLLVGVSVLTRLDRFMWGVVLMYTGMFGGLLLGCGLVVVLGFTSWLSALVVIVACLVLGFGVGMEVGARLMDGEPFIEPTKWLLHK